MVKIVSMGLAGAVLLSLATVAMASGGIEGRWKAETIAGKPLAKDITSEIEIAADGQVSGTGGCNRLVSHATIKGSKLTFGPIAGTMMMCDDAKMEQERAFHDALASVRRFSLKSDGGTLVLKSKSGRTVAVLARQ